MLVSGDVRRRAERLRSGTAEAHSQMGAGWLPLPTEVILLWRATAVLTTALFGLVAAILLAGPLGSALPAPWRTTSAVAALSTTLLLMIDVVLAPVRHRRWHWRVTSSTVEVETGVLWCRSVIVPRSRIQYLEVSAGPLRRRLGLERIDLYTAGALEHLTLPGLTPPAAHSLAVALGFEP